MKDLNLIRKIAWSFHHTTGMEFDDLFSEATLAYCKAEKEFNPNKGAGFSTFAFIYIRCSLLDYVHKNNRYKDHFISIQEAYHFAKKQTYQVESSLEMFSTKEAQEIANVILDSPQEFANLLPKQAIKKIGDIMINKKHWNWASVWKGVRDLKCVLS